MADLLVLSTIAGFSASTEHGPVEIRSRKSQAMLLFLALSPQMSSSRERVYGMLWPDVPLTQAQDSLRREVWTARRALNQSRCDVLVSSRLNLALKPDCCRADIEELLAAAAGGGPIPEMMLSHARIADEIGAGLEDLMGEWLYIRRQEIHNRLAFALEARLAAGLPDLKTRLDVARALFKLDPTHELACQALMRSLAETGNRAGALQAYSELWNELGSQHDDEPSAATQALYVAIKSQGPQVSEGGVAEPPLPAAAAHLPATTVATRRGSTDARPIAIYAPTPETGALSDDRRRLVAGVHGDLVGCLIRFREWRIHTSTPSAVDVTGDDYVLLANVSESSAELALTFTLRSLREDQIVWSETEEIRAGSPLKMQKRIVHRLAISLNVYISADRLARFRAQGDVDLDVYDRWLRSQELFQSYRGGSWKRAEELLASIIAREPGFSRAYSAMAQLENSRHLAVPGLQRTEAARLRALEFSEAAVQFDPLDNRAHLSRAWSLAMAGRYQQVEVVFESAVRLNPYDPWTLTSAALGMAFVGQTDLARALLEQAEQAGISDRPVYTAYLGTLHFLLENYPACIAAVDRAGDAIHNLPGWKAAALALMGEREAARRVASDFALMSADRWQGAVEPSPEAVANWFLHCFPIRRASVWMTLRHALEDAGLATGAASSPFSLPYFEQ